MIWGRVYPLYITLCGLLSISRSLWTVGLIWERVYPLYHSRVCSQPSIPLILKARVRHEAAKILSLSCTFILYSSRLDSRIYLNKMSQFQAVLRIRIRWIRKILACGKMRIRIQGAKISTSTTKNLLSKPKSELLKKEML